MTTMALPLFDRPRNELVEQYLPLARMLAKRFSKTVLGRRLGTYDDCFQEAVRGIMRAAELYDPSRDVKFKTYAFTSAMRAMTRAAQKCGVIRISNTALEAMHRPERSEREETMAVQCAQALVSWPLPDNYDVETIGDAERRAVEREQRVVVRQMLKQLTKRERLIIRHRFGLGTKEKSRAEVAKHFKITKSRVHQLEQSGLEKLNARLLRERWSAADESR